MTTTYTRTHVYVTFANPYMVCDLCWMPVSCWHDEDKCGCEEGWWNEPCGHEAGAVSECSSWSPVDGCQCAALLGHVPHPTTTTEKG